MHPLKILIENGIGIPNMYLCSFLCSTHEITATYATFNALCSYDWVNQVYKGYIIKSNNRSEIYVKILNNLTFLQRHLFHWIFKMMYYLISKWKKKEEISDCNNKSKMYAFHFFCIKKVMNTYTTAVLLCQSLIIRGLYVYIHVLDEI